MGFRFEDGRLDDAQHPFTCGLHPQDVRLTTHLYCDDLLGTLGGTIHEGGHGLYEQGLPTAWAGTGLRAAAGAGMHESQSRFWENVIGRSEAFFQWFAPILDDELGGGGPSAAALYAAANRVEPSFIRVHADETTYNVHILLRFELEVALFEGQLSVADLPEAWNAGMVRLLGIRPPDLNQGVLQDVHWSSGLFGYFPSYTLGNLYAASFRAALETELPSVWELVARGEFAPVLAWLREKVHVHGSRLDAPALFVAAVGDRDPVADLEAHLRQRIG
jgi:carboxypeptidase Taq